MPSSAWKKKEWKHRAADYLASLMALAGNDEDVAPPQSGDRIGDRLAAILDLFFFNDTATTEIYTLSLHDALPILPPTYWPRTELRSASSSLWVWIAASTSAFSERTECASNFTGGSIATSDSSWNRWFGTMSRRAPVAS